MAKQRRPNLKISEIKQALTEARGFKSVAAQILGVGNSTISARVKRSPELQKHLDGINEQYKDFVVGKLYEKISGGDTTCIIFYLKTQCQDRGFAEKKIVIGNVNLTHEDWIKQIKEDDDE